MVGKQDGGPAFPGLHGERAPTGGPGWNSETIVERQHMGMSLRDWFAGQALSTLVSLPGRYGRVLQDMTPEQMAQDNFDKMAENCWKFADALIAERSK